MTSGDDKRQNTAESAESEEVRDSAAEEASQSSGEHAPAEGGGTPPQADPDSAGESDLKTQLDEARRKADEHWELYVRAQAEADNIRRRAKRDVEHAQLYSLEKFVAELLPVKDSLEIGVQAARGEGPAARTTAGSESASGDDPRDKEIEALREGTELTLKKLSQALEKFGVEEVNPQGETFDPQVHEAVSTQPTDDVAPDTVVTVMQKGYLLNKRVVRPALVVVAQQPSGESGQGTGSGGQEQGG